MKPIIVTGFWDVGRGKNCPIPRSNERYFQEFEQWARIRNKLIVFIDADKTEKVKEIRRKYGLEDRTTIIPIDDIYSIESHVYKQLMQIEKEEDFTYKLIPDAMSNRAAFDYAWFMIYWCIAEAGKICSENEMIAWFDFGFNHMNHCYTNMEEFDFEWECTQTNMDKIHLYSMMDISQVSIWDCLQFQFDTIMSPFQLIPAKLAGKMWETMKTSMNALLMMGIIDDDQMLLLIACKNFPELYEVHISEMWYLALKENGAEHLTTNGRKVVCKYDIHLPIENEIANGKTSDNNKYIRFSNRILQRLKKYELILQE